MKIKFFARAAAALVALTAVAGHTDQNPAIHVNQHAYLPLLEKGATYRPPQDDENIKQPREWALKSGPKIIAQGTTEYFGLDEGSQEVVHRIDFTQVQNPGTYHLQVRENGRLVPSYRFEIRTDALNDLKRQALHYFYHHRSDQPILEKYVDEKWHARPTGHPDNQVQTAPCFEEPKGPDCRVFDGSGGWYDAGDHGKYVVNGGISVWTLLNLYERSKHWGGNLAELDDGTLPIPEQDNGVPDILDEARYQIEWFKRMQVPEGYQHAGMVHHKLHSVQWTELPMRPDRDDLPRIAQPVSTGATLNFAAALAQCARIYQPFDKAFADGCLHAAKVAYQAAKQNPEIYALASTPGAGPYGDKNLGDEFYWAAAELYLSTGEQKYLDELKASPYHLSLRGDYPDMDDDIAIPHSIKAWPRTHMLGALSMATAGAFHNANAKLVDRTQQLVIEAADHYVTMASQQGYGQPYPGDAVVWGSNSDIVNNMLVLGLANDFSCGGKPDYVNAMQAGLNYLLGRNPLDQSYVTRYGDRPLLAPHHRFWANPLDKNYPTAPAGALSGGPNQSIQDPVAQEFLKDCAPLKCFIDHINSWATNEITINWNAPFAWTLYYLDEQSNKEQREKMLQRCSSEDE